MNGSNGLQPTLELTTANGNNGYAYPVMPFYPNNNNDGFFGGDGIWGLVLLALLFSNGGFGFGGGYGMMNGMYEFPWLLNGQQGINNNTNQGFDNLHLSNQIEGARNSLSDIAQAICNSTSSINSNISNGTASINSNICNGFANAEISANARQMADMQQNFNNQLSTLQSFNGLERQLCECCSDNRLATANLTATVLSENCADRQALSEGIRDIIANQTAGIQSIKDQLCQDKIDQKNDEIAQLRQEILYARGQASQVAQTQAITSGVYNELKNCPVGTVPVFGNQAIFSCSNNLNGCGCMGNSQFI